MAVYVQRLRESGQREGAALAEIKKFRQDYEDAAGELLVDINDAQPGSLVSKLLIANRIMSRERDAAQGAQADLAAMREITTLDFDERKSIATVLKEVLEARDKIRAERDTYKKFASSRAILVREKRRLILAQREKIAKLEKLTRCDSVDPLTGHQCEDDYGHTTELHCFETYAWPKTEDDA